jgi:hypothetical protein
VSFKKFEITTQIDEDDYSYFHRNFASYGVISRPYLSTREVFIILLRCSNMGGKTNTPFMNEYSITNESQSM